MTKYLKGRIFCGLAQIRRTLAEFFLADKKMKENLAIDI